MKRIGIWLLICVLLLGLAACNTTVSPTPDDSDYQKGVAALEKGEYEEAYNLLSLSADERAATLLQKLVFVPTERTEGEGTRILYRYDESGNILSVEGSYGYTATYTYNEKNQLVKLEEKTAGSLRTTAYTYDERGDRVTKEWDGGEVKTHFAYTYDEKHRCTRVVQTDGDGSVFTTDRRYDDGDNLTYERVTYPDGTWYEETATYNAANLLEKSTIDSNGDRHESVYTYNEAGLLLKRTVAGGDYTYTYDEKGQCTKEVWPDGKTVSYTYDEKGNCLSEKTVISSGDEYSTTYTYDEKGNVLSQESNLGGQRRFTYDSYGNKLTEESIGDAERDYAWQYKWELRYYPDGVPEEVEEIRLENVNIRLVI